MTKTPRPDPDLLHRQAQVAVLVELLAGSDLDAMMAAVAPAEVRGWFTPDVALLEIAATALELAVPPGAAPLEYEGLREGHLPELTFSGRVEHRNSQYALYAAACMRGGLQPDLAHDAGWWNTRLWTYGVYAVVIYVRAAVERTGKSLDEVVLEIAGRHDVLDPVEERRR